jgi:hypothetical protein
MCGQQIIIHILLRSAGHGICRLFKPSIPCYVLCAVFAPQVGLKASVFWRLIQAAKHIVC